MALASEVKYEVHVSDGGRWTVFTDAPTKGRAIQQAQQLLGSGKFDAAKVTEERGQSREILVWKEERQRVERPETINSIDDAPVCTTIDDFYELEARLVGGRLLRQYLDNRSITVLELMHDAVLLRELSRKEEIFYAAIRTVAAILARKSDKKPVDVVASLEHMSVRMRQRVEQMGSIDTFDAALAGGLDRLMEAVTEAKGARERAFFVRATLARRLRKWRDWEGKLSEMLDLADMPASDAAFVHVDEAIAEILDGSEAVQELLGYQRNLASAIQLLVRISGGAYKLSQGSNTPLERLSALFGRRPMIRTKAVITERVCRTLSGVGALTKGDRREEQDAFNTLVHQMIGSAVFVNSGPLCEAVTLRAKSVLKDEFADESSEKAIDDIIQLLPTLASRIGYLMDLLGTDFGKRSQSHIIACLAKVLTGVTSVTQFVEHTTSSAEIVRAAAGLRDRLLATDLPQEWRQRFAKRIYDLLVIYSTKGASPAPEPAPATHGLPTQGSATQTASADQPPPAKQGRNGSARRRDIPAGELIFREGEPGTLAYIVTSGTVEILKRAGDRDIVIGEVGAGEIIGEMAIIDTAPRMASARAVVDTVLAAIPRDDLKARLDRLEKFDPVLRRLMSMFIQRMRDTRFMPADS